VIGSKNDRLLAGEKRCRGAGVDVKAAILWHLGLIDGELGAAAGDGGLDTGDIGGEVHFYVLQGSAMVV
jgi:hypothetical protein